MNIRKTKKIILYIAGPGVLLVECIAIFLHLFTASDTKPWIIAGMAVFFIVFIPLFSIEYFKQIFGEEKDKEKIQFKRKKTRTEWEGGNIHGKIPREVERAGKLFK